MTLMIVNYILIIILCGLNIYLFISLKKTNTHIRHIALSIADVRDTVNRVDSSTGSEIFQLRKEFEAFKDDYGDAAIEEMRESARREKAWADGIDNIMSFGPNVYGSGRPGRGDST